MHGVCTEFFISQIISLIVLQDTKNYYLDTDFEYHTMKLSVLRCLN
jgi:hypothetical protein